MLIIRRSKLYYTASGIITPIGGCPVHRLRDEFLSQTVQRTATYRCDGTRHSSSSSSRWPYSPGWALAHSKICLQASRFLALSLHSFIPIFLRSMDKSSSHLILCLPLRLVAYSFPYIFFGISVSRILSIWPSHRILWHLINLTMFSPLIMASNSSF